MSHIELSFSLALGGLTLRLCTKLKLSRPLHSFFYYYYFGDRPFSRSIYLFPKFITNCSAATTPQNFRRIQLARMNVSVAVLDFVIIRYVFQGYAEIHWAPCNMWNLILQLVVVMRFMTFYVIFYFVKRL